MILYYIYIFSIVYLSSSLSFIISSLPLLLEALQEGLQKHEGRVGETFSGSFQKDKAPGDTSTSQGCDNQHGGRQAESHNASQQVTFGASAI